MSARDAHATSGDALRLVDPVGDDLERRYAADAWRAEELASGFREVVGDTGR